MGRPKKNTEQAAVQASEPKSAKQTTMTAILAAFNGIESPKVAELECKRFMEDLKIAGNEALRTHTDHKLLDAKRDLENAEIELRDRQEELEATKNECSEDAITIHFLNALKDCKSKGPRRTFNDVLDALNPYTYEEKIANAQKKVDDAQAKVDAKKEIVDKNTKIIDMIKMTMDRLFNETIDVPENEKKK